MFVGLESFFFWAVQVVFYGLQLTGFDLVKVQLRLLEQDEVIRGLYMEENIWSPGIKCDTLSFHAKYHHNK